MNQCNCLKQKTKLLTQNAMHFHRKKNKRKTKTTNNLCIGHHLDGSKNPKISTCVKKGTTGWQSACKCNNQQILDCTQQKTKSKNN